MTMESLATNGHDEKTGKVSLETLAKMTGFPIEMVKEEVFKGRIGDNEDISLEELRAAMLAYIDSTMLMSEQK
jgi:predicted HTH domain antitoxin